MGGWPVRPSSAGDMSAPSGWVDLAQPRPLVMGVVNVTPDSFSDGGRWFGPEQALAHAHELLAAGAAIIDVGGESTRPGADRPSEDEELRRVVPVVEALAAEGVVVSVDTMRASVARASVEVGAAIINDVSAGLADDGMLPLIAQCQLPYVAMHWRGHSADMYGPAQYADVVAEVLAELQQRVADLVGAGVQPENIILDPGLGFAKTAEHNWALMRALDRFVATGHRVLLGSSRKTFLGRVGRAEADRRPPTERDTATAVTSLYGAMAGCWAVRVHDVTSTVDALDVWEAMQPPRDREPEHG